MDRNLDFLEYLDPDEEYEQWTGVGMALKSAGYSVKDWIDWSSQGPKFKKCGEEGCEYKWSTFTGKGIGIGTCIYWAKLNGYVPGGSKGGAIEFDGVIEKDARGYVAPKPSEELIRYLTSLFKPDEYVSYVCDSEQNKDGKWVPASRGTFGFTAGQIIEKLKKNPDDIGAAIGDYPPEAGGWIRPNPVDGKGVNDKNITAFRFLLIESDNLAIEKQLEKIDELNLPCAAIVHSGGKSLHAIIHIDAKDEKEYSERVRNVFRICEENGFPVDHANKNPARLSRMPGLDRNGKHQKLIRMSSGAASYESWAEWAETNLDSSLPEILNLSSALASLPELKEELIEGVLRRQAKFMVAGPSKAGKSFSLIELATAMSGGKSWLGNPCRRSRVLYINFELDSASCLHRFNDVSKKFGQGLTESDLEGIDIWNMRGNAMKLDAFVPKLLARARHKGYSLIIIDPIYKIITGDENSATDMGYFCNLFDRIIEELGCSVAYCHHYSKGAQNAKRSGDRASGSGVFTRDGDVISTLTELDKKSAAEKWDIGSSDDDKLSFWRMEYTLRDFAPKPPTDMAFKYPVHEVDTHGYLADVEFADALMGAARQGNRNFKKSQEERDEEYRRQFENAYSCSSMDNHTPTKEDIMKYTEWSDATFKRRFKLMNGKYDITKTGIIVKT